MSHRALGNQFHGTSHEIPVGDVIRPGARTGGASMVGGERKTHAYAVDDIRVANSWSNISGGARKVYAVEPVDSNDVDFDPNMHDETPEEGDPKSLRSEAGWRVVDDVTAQASEARQRQVDEEWEKRNR